MYALYYYQVFKLKYLHTMHVTRCETHILDSIVSLMGFQNYVHHTTWITCTMYMWSTITTIMYTCTIVRITCNVITTLHDSNFIMSSFRYIHAHYTQLQQILVQVCLHTSVPHHPHSIQYMAIITTNHYSKRITTFQWHIKMRFSPKHYIVTRQSMMKLLLWVRGSVAHM